MDYGFRIAQEYGICEMQNSVASGSFCYEDFALGAPIIDDVTKGYIQFFHCVK